MAYDFTCKTCGALAEFRRNNLPKKVEWRCSNPECAHHDPLSYKFHTMPHWVLERGESWVKYVDSLP